MSEYGRRSRSPPDRVRALAGHHHHVVGAGLEDGNPDGLAAIHYQIRRAPAPAAISRRIANGSSLRGLSLARSALVGTNAGPPAPTDACQIAVAAAQTGKAQIGLRVPRPRCAPRGGRENLRQAHPGAVCVNSVGRPAAPTSLPKRWLRPASAGGVVLAAPLADTASAAGLPAPRCPVARASASNA